MNSEGVGPKLLDRNVSFIFLLNIFLPHDTAFSHLSEVRPQQTDSVLLGMCWSSQIFMRVACSIALHHCC